MPSSEGTEQTAGEEKGGQEGSQGQDESELSAGQEQESGAGSEGTEQTAGEEKGGQEGSQGEGRI